jgi:hypothetical protein
MSKKVAITFSVLSLVTILSLVVVAGCGGEDGGDGSLSEPAQLLDTALREASKGNYQPSIELIRPDLRDALGQIFEEEAQFGSREIIEAHYRTDEIDPDHVVVYYWGTFQTTEEGEVKTETIGEAEAQGLPMVREDGQWYFDFSSPIPEKAP